MRTSALRYLLCGFLMLLTNFEFAGIDWTPDVIGAAVVLLGLRELKVFDAESGTGFAKAAKWAVAALLSDAMKTALLFFPAALTIRPWLESLTLLCTSVLVFQCGAGVFRLAVCAGQHDLAAQLRQSVLTATICSVTSAVTKLLSVAVSVSALTIVTIMVVTLASAAWLASVLLRAQKRLRPFFG